MNGFQTIFGRPLITDSGVVFLQTLVNPFYPFTYGKKLINELKETQQQAASSSVVVQSVNNGINDILEVLKPKIIDGISELADSGLLKELHPIVNITIKINNEYHDKEESPRKSTIAYDLIDFDEFNKHHQQSNSSNKSDPISDDHPSSVHHQPSNSSNKSDAISDHLPSKIEINSTIHEIEYNNATVYPDDETTHSSLIDNEQLESTQSNQQHDIEEEIADKSHQTTYSVAEFRESKLMSKNLELNGNQADVSQVGDLKYEILPDKAPIDKSDDAPIVDKTTEHLQTTYQTSQTNNQTNQMENPSSILNDKLNNKTEYMHGEDLDKAIISLISCDGDKCVEEILDSPHNRTQAYQSNKELVKPMANFANGFKKVMNKLRTDLIVKPAYYVKERLVSLNNLIKRDLHLLFKMAQAIFGSVSSACRYKFLCLFSSFFSLHTPNFVKSSMPTRVENYFFNVIESANRNEFLNAIAIGYVGLDCNDIYADNRCPE